MSSFSAQARRALPGLSSAAELVRWAAGEFDRFELFYGHGTDNATDEAVVLVFHALGLGFDASDEELRAPVTNEAKEYLLEVLIRRVEQRCPAPYITGEAWFAGHRFQIDERVLIPRSPLAEWIDEQFSPWVKPRRVRRILDVGTGSGCIAVALAHAFPMADVVGVDLSADALAIARTNVSQHGLTERVQLIETDVYDGLEGCFDLIVSNPPYVDARALEAMPSEFRHEPMTGLAGGHDGLLYVHRIVGEARRHMSDHAVLVVEVGASEAAFQAAYPKLTVTWLELALGGEGVLLVDAKDLDDLQG